MNITHGYHNRFTLFKGGYKSWKPNSNKVEDGYVHAITPGNIRPNPPSGSNNVRRARPLFHFRRGVNGDQVGSSKPTIRESMDMPGGLRVGTNTTDEATCLDNCLGVQQLVYVGPKTNMSNNPKPDTCYSQANFAKKRVLHPTLLKKNYHTRLEDKRRVNNAKNCCPEIVKPSNAKYHVQGAVDSGTRLERLKLEAIQSSKTKYVGDYKETYNLKNKTNFENCKVYGKKCR